MQRNILHHHTLWGGEATVKWRETTVKTGRNSEEGRQTGGCWDKLEGEGRVVVWGVPFWGEETIERRASHQENGEGSHYEKGWFLWDLSTTNALGWKVLQFGKCKFKLNPWWGENICWLLEYHFFLFWLSEPMWLTGIKESEFKADLHRKDARSLCPTLVKPVGQWQKWNSDNVYPISLQWALMKKPPMQQKTKTMKTKAKACIGHTFPSLQRRPW